jgi:hypothetical protein
MHTVEAFLDSPEGRSIRLHSGRDPVGEAARWLDSALPGGEVPEFLVLLGAGLGYVFDALETRAVRPRVLLIESDPALLAAMRARRDWSGWLDSGRLIVLSGPDYAGQGDAWRHVPRPEIDWPVLAHPVLLRERPAATRAAQAVAERILFDARANADSRTALARTYLLHTLANTGVIAREGNAGALFNAFPGVPAIVIGAGPSLDSNLDALATVGDRALMIAADTALRPLLSAGVAPQIVLAADPSEANARHLQDLPPCGATWLVAEGSVGSGAFAAFAGRTFVFRLGTHEPWPWLESLGIARASLRAWGSVVTSAFDLAIQAGCDPIIFAGLDLAFTRERPYCRGVTWEEDWAREALHGQSGKPLAQTWRESMARWKLTTEQGIDGHPVTTAPHLQAFRNWIVEQTPTLGRRIVNGTGAGILVGGAIEQRDLAGAVREWLPVDPLDLQATLRRTHAHRTDGPRTQERMPALLTELARTTAGAARRDPIDAWVAFAPGVDAEAIRVALGDACEMLAAPAPAPPPSIAPPVQPQTVWDPFVGLIRVPPPERAATLHAAAVDQVIPEWVRHSRDVRIADDVDSTSLVHAIESALRADAYPARRLDELVASFILRFEADADRAAHSWRLLAAWMARQPAHTALPRILNGLLSLSAWPSPDPCEPSQAPPRSVLESTVIRRLTPRVLTNEGVGRGVSVHTFDDRHAIVTPYGGRCSVLVAEDGSHRPLPEWPHPIVAEVPWGAEGGALAWGNHDRQHSHLMFRRTGHSTPEIEVLPFSAGATLLTREDGTAIFPSHHGGLWQWAPGTGAHRMAEAPPCIGIGRLADGIRLDPVSRDARDRPTRDLARDAFLYRVGHVELTRVPLDRRGQRWSLATAAGWTATAFPQTDLVHVVQASRRRAFDLVCDYPVALGWAGRSLIVATCHSEILLFGQLQTSLDAADATAERHRHD